MASKKKESIGRQKFPMANIENENYRQVTFSKRRAGLLKKASELSTLCGAEIAIIGFSPAKKPFGFGYLGVESFVDRCLFQNNMSSPPTQQQLHAYGAAICQKNMELTRALSGLEDEKKKRQAIEEKRKGSVRLSKTKGWEKPVEEMNVFQLQEMKHELEELLKTHKSFQQQKIKS